MQAGLMVINGIFTYRQRKLRFPEGLYDAWHAQQDVDKSKQASPAAGEDAGVPGGAAAEAPGGMQSSLPSVLGEKANLDNTILNSVMHLSAINPRKMCDLALLLRPLVVRPLPFLLLSVGHGHVLLFLFCWSMLCMPAPPGSTV